MSTPGSSGNKRWIAASAMLAIGLFAAARDATAGPIIPPGREAILGEMLGGGGVTLAGSCKLLEASVKQSFVEARYRCGDAGDLAVTLGHPEGATNVARKTDRFAISIPPNAAASAAFLDDLAARVKSREGAWEWGTASEGKGPPPDAPPLVADETADPASRAAYEKGYELYKQRKHGEALPIFIDLARKNPRQLGVLGMIVANTASTEPSAAVVAKLTADADAKPEDPLAQFMAGVAAHYSSHYTAKTRDDKKRLYETAIKYLVRARPAFDFEPRVFIYLAVSHYRLGHQAEAEALIDHGIMAAREDPDTHYCRAEILHRKDPARAIKSLDEYERMLKVRAELNTVPAGKNERVRQMRERLQAALRGEVDNTEMFDPLLGEGMDKSGLASPAVFGKLVGGVALVAALATGAMLARRRRKVA